MDKNPLLKYMMDDEKREDFFHTSRHARIQSGANMGAASTETFAQRRMIDQNRTRVKKYSDSRIAAQAMVGHERPKVYTPPNKGAGGASTGRRPAGPGIGPRPPISPVR